MSRAHLAVAAVFAVAAVVATSLDGEWWLGVLLAVLFGLLGVQLGVVRLTVTADSVRVAQGPWRAGRVIPRAEVTDAQVTDLSFGQVVGVGLPEHPLMSRLTVRSGPTLLLVLASGERVWISAVDPAEAVRATATT